MKKLTVLALSLLLAVLTSAARPAFEDNFCDSTLSLYYVFGADSLRTHVMLRKQVATPVWAGRRHNLDSLPLAGSGRITVTDIQSGDTIYLHSFASLFQEWLSTEEAQTESRAFENVYLVPLPKRPALISIELNDNSQKCIAHSANVYNPNDELVVRPTRITPLPHRYTHSATADCNPIDIAILAEGYTEDEMETFFADAALITQEILSYQPFKRYADRLNFVAVATPSLDSGVSTPLKGEWLDTAVGSHFSSFHADRYLTTDDVFKIHDQLRGIPYEHLIVLANTDIYGGGGIYNSYTLSAAHNEWTLPVIVHEFGHSFGGLGDEYFYEDGGVLDEAYLPDYEPWEPNITTLADFGSKWADMLAEGTPVPTPIEMKDNFEVGVYEGGGYAAKGVYRPVDECRMRSNTCPGFCPVCERTIERIITFYTE